MDETNPNDGTSMSSRTEKWKNHPSEVYIADFTRARRGRVCPARGSIGVHGVIGGIEIHGLGVARHRLVVLLAIVVGVTALLVVLGRGHPSQSNRAVGLFPLVVAYNSTRVRARRHAE